MADITFEKNQDAVTEVGQTEETNSYATERRQINSHLPPSTEKNADLSMLQQKIQSSTESVDEEIESSAFEKLEEIIHQYTEEGNIVKLREIENFIVRWQKYVQQQYKKLISSQEGGQIQPDGKISFEEMSKIVAGKRYSYTRMYWKENGVKKGKVLKTEPQITNEE